MLDKIVFIFTLTFVHYFGFAALLYWFYYVFGRERFTQIRIQQRVATRKDFRREFLLSSVSASIYAMVLYLCLYAPFFQPYSRMYHSVAEFGVLYWVLSGVGLLVLHDTWFYWTHRLLHTPYLLKTVHAYHHRSLAPTPFSAFAFHPVEALITVAVYPLALLLFPVHLYLFMGWWLVIVVGNMFGHLGFEPLQRWIHTKLFGYFLGSTHHNLHHQNGRIWFGFLFAFWDRRMGTGK